MRPFALLLCLLLGSIVWAAEPSPEPDDDNDAKKILGTWELVKAEMDGKPLPDAASKGMKIEITKDRFIVATVGKDGKEMARYKLDMKSKPRGIDVIPKDAGERVVKGIYNFDKGELTMCWGEPDTGRPAKFDEKNRMIMVLRKTKATK